MKTLNEWLDSRVADDDSVIHSQIDQLVNRLAGLIHGLDEGKKSEMVNLFIKQVEERIGL